MSRKSLYWAQALEYHTSCEMKTLYAGDTGRLLLKKGKLTIGKVITFVVEFCFQSSSFVDFKVKVKVKNISYFQLIWIDEMQIIMESRIVHHL